MTNAQTRIRELIPAELATMRDRADIERICGGVGLRTAHMLSVFEELEELTR